MGGTSGGPLSRRALTPLLYGELLLTSGSAAVGQLIHQGAAFAVRIGLAHQRADVRVGRSFALARFARAAGRRPRSTVEGRPAPVRNCSRHRPRRLQDPDDRRDRLRVAHGQAPELGVVDDLRAELGALGLAAGTRRPARRLLTHPAHAAIVPAAPTASGIAGTGSRVDDRRQPWSAEARTALAHCSTREAVGTRTMPPSASRMERASRALAMFSR